MYKNSDYYKWSCFFPNTYSSYCRISCIRFLPRYATWSRVVFHHTHTHTINQNSNKNVNFLQCVCSRSSLNMGIGCRDGWFFRDQSWNTITRTQQERLNCVRGSPAGAVYGWCAIERAIRRMLHLRDRAASYTFNLSQLTCVYDFES